MAEPEPLSPVRLSLVVPCFNEEQVLPQTIARLRALLDGLEASGSVNSESAITFIDDGSKDSTWRLIEEAHADDARVRGLRLSSNRGHQNALLAGLLTAPGDVLISLDADLQDDLAAIPKMLAAHARGAEIVYGVRTRRAPDGVFKSATAHTYYWLLRRLGANVIPDHADFRLMSRHAIDAIARFDEVNLFLRGVVPLLGFNSEIVEYERQPRLAGQSKYSFAKMAALAFDGIFAFSTVPLSWITFLGFFGAMASIAAGLWALWARLMSGQTLPGWASTVIPMYFLGSVQLLALGIIGGYVSRIYSETKRRPRFIVDKSI
jgi:glycosyltransferase involved in cell wall biosynthesis